MGQLRLPYPQMTGRTQVSIDICVFFSGLLAIAAPKSFAWLLPMLAVCAAVALMHQGAGLRGLLRPHPLALALGAFFLAGAASALWALDPGGALSHALLGLMTVTCAQVIVLWLDSNQETALRSSRWFVAGFLVGAAFVVFEIQSSLWLQRLISVTFDPDHPANLAHLKRNALTGNMLVWATLMIGFALWGDWRAWALALVLGAATLTITFGSDHGTSKIAIIASTFAFALAFLLPRMAHHVLFASWVVAFIVVIPLSIYAYQELRLQSRDSLQLSAQHRIIIWGKTANATLEAPILGHGVRTMSQISRDEVLAHRGQDVLGVDAVAPHAHNVYLQTLYELGVVGFLLMLGVGFTFARAIAGLSAQAYPFGVATAAAGLIEIFSSYEVWEGWLLGVLAFTTVAVIWAGRLVEQARPKMSA